MGRSDRNLSAAFIDEKSRDGLARADVGMAIPETPLRLREQPKLLLAALWPGGQDGLFDFFELSLRPSQVGLRKLSSQSRLFSGIHVGQFIQREYAELD